MPTRPSRSASSALASAPRRASSHSPRSKRELPERRPQLDLRRHVADPLGQRERLAVARAGGLVVALGVLEVVPERLQRQHRLRGVRLARQRDRALEVLARLRGVADAPEHAAEDPVRAARGARLAERLREPQRLLGRVDRQHVVADLHVQPGGVLVEPHQRQRRLAVLDQVDALLVVLDRALALALVRERRADLAMELGDVNGVVLAALVLEAALPRGDRRLDPAEAQGDVARLLGDALRRGLVLAGQRRGSGVVAERLVVGVQRGRCVARRLAVAQRAAAQPLLLGGGECASCRVGRRARVVLGDHRARAAAPGPSRMNAATSAWRLARAALGSIS